MNENHSIELTRNFVVVFHKLKVRWFNDVRFSSNNISVSPVMNSHDPPETCGNPDLSEPDPQDH